MNDILIFFVNFFIDYIKIFIIKKSAAASLYHNRFIWSFFFIVLFNLNFLSIFFILILILFFVILIQNISF